METVEQYMSRLFSYVGDENPVGILQRTVEEVRKLFTGNSPGRQSADDRWSAAQILAHLAEGEMIFAYRIRMIASVNGTPIPAYDQNLWVANAGYLTEQPQLALELLEITRKANLAFLRSLPQEKWEYYGVHEERGKETIRNVVRLYAGHDLNHLRQLKQLFG